jgi:hypothetical protein
MEIKTYAREIPADDGAAKGFGTDQRVATSSPWRPRVAS